MVSAGVVRQDKPRAHCSCPACHDDFMQRHEGFTPAYDLYWDEAGTPLFRHIVFSRYAAWTHSTAASPFTLLVQNRHVTGEGRYQLSLVRAGHTVLD